MLWWGYFLLIICINKFSNDWENNLEIIALLYHEAITNESLTRNEETVGTQATNSWSTCSLRLAPSLSVRELTSSGSTVKISNNGDTAESWNRLMRSSTGLCHVTICSARSARARHSCNRHSTMPVDKVWYRAFHFTIYSDRSSSNQINWQW